MLISEVPTCLENDLGNMVARKHDLFVYEILSRKDKVIRDYISKSIKRLSKIDKIGHFAMTMQRPGFVQEIRQLVYDIKTVHQQFAMPSTITMNIEEMHELMLDVNTKLDRLKTLRIEAKDLKRKVSKQKYGNQSATRWLPSQCKKLYYSSMSGS